LRRELDFFFPLEEERRRELDLLDELRLRDEERCFVGMVNLCLLLNSPRL
jgi:hypothetical protein